MRCKNCGQELADDTKFCTNCGCPVDIPRPPSKSANEDDFIMVTTSSISHYKIVSVYGVIFSSWVEIAASRSGLFEAIDAFSGNLGGDSYLSSVEEKCHAKSSERLASLATNNNCNAIVGLRYNTFYSDNVIHVTAYGTACIVEKEK